jgi:hypothetical protein
MEGQRFDIPSVSSNGLSIAALSVNESSSAMNSPFSSCLRLVSCCRLSFSRSAGDIRLGGELGVSRLKPF